MQRADPLATVSKPGIQRVQALADISRSRYIVIATKLSCAPIANPSNSAQLVGTPTVPASNTQVCAVVWACSNGQTDTRACDQYTFRVVYDSSEM